MEQIELIQHWNYFCSLAERLDDTKHYIDHGLQEHDGIRELVHGKVYSDIFKQIIVLAASEFEIMSRQSLKNIQQIHIPKELLLGKTGPKKLNLARWRVKMQL